MASPGVPPEPVLPDYGGACIDSVVPALLGRRPRSWLPAAATGAEQIVLLVVDGLGWEQLQERRALAPTLCGMEGGFITSVAPSTTAAALTSITMGCAPAVHGVVGYRVRVADVGPDGGDGVLNVLRWQVGGQPARDLVDPQAFQPDPAFDGQSVPVITRAEVLRSGFTAAHLAQARLLGWRMPSTLVAEVRRCLRGGERFVFAYYDGVDKVAHEYGLDDRYEAEIVAADRLVADLVDSLPAGAALVVIADHGQVEVGSRVQNLDPSLLAPVRLLSGEGRFRWLHTSDPDGVARRARQLYGEVAWVGTRGQLVDAGWFGGHPKPAAEERLGDVAIVPFAPIAFLDPADTGEMRLVARHGSLTSAEMLVPLLVATG